MAVLLNFHEALSWSPKRSGRTLAPAFHTAIMASVTGVGRTASPPTRLPLRTASTPRPKMVHSQALPGSRPKWSPLHDPARVSTSNFEGSRNNLRNSGGSTTSYDRGVQSSEEKRGCSEVLKSQCSAELCLPLASLRSSRPQTSLPLGAVPRGPQSSKATIKCYFATSQCR